MNVLFAAAVNRPPGGQTRCLADFVSPKDRQPTLLGRWPRVSVDSSPLAGADKEGVPQAHPLDSQLRF